MAEVAIPIAVLGAMYIISNKNDKKENYSNIKQTLTNTKPIVKNFPKKIMMIYLIKLTFRLIVDIKMQMKNYINLLDIKRL